METHDDRDDFVQERQVGKTSNCFEIKLYSSFYLFVMDASLNRVTVTTNGTMDVGNPEHEEC